MISISFIYLWFWPPYALIQFLQTFSNSFSNWGWDLFCAPGLHESCPSLRQGGMCSLIGGFEMLLGFPRQSPPLCPNGTASLLYLWTHSVLLGTSQHMCWLCWSGRADETKKQSGLTLLWEDTMLIICLLFVCVLKTWHAIVKKMCL